MAFMVDDMLGSFATGLAFVAWPRGAVAAAAFCTSRRQGTSEAKTAHQRCPAEDIAGTRCGQWFRSCGGFEVTPASLTWCTYRS